MMKNKKEKNNSKLKTTKLRLPNQFYTLTFRILSYVFILLILTMTIALGLTAMLYYGGLFPSDGQPPVSPVLLIVLLVLVSSLIGCVLSVALYSLSFKEFNQFRAAMNKVAGGDFTVTLPNSEESYMHELNNSFNSMVRSLKSIETLKTDFISDFSHEFKTPISSICGFAKLLQNPNISEEEKKEYIDIIITESHRLTQLSKNTLSMSKLDNHETVYEKSVYRIDEQLRKCVLMFQTEMDSKKIDLSLSGEDVSYYGNEDLTQQMWINLISNAVKFTPDGGSVEISVSSDDELITVSIRDTGCGMDEVTRKHIFDKFFQGDTSHTVAGNGLGLSIVAKIVQITGGKIEVESTPGKGTLFTIELPNLKSNEEKSERNQGKMQVEEFRSFGLFNRKNNFK